MRILLTHPTETLEAVSSELSLVPSNHKRVGEPRTTPTGLPLRGNYASSLWAYDFQVKEALDLTDSLRQILARLESHGQFFHKHVSSGGNVELFCGIFADGNWDEVFPRDLLRQLVDLGLDLRLDVYTEHDDSLA